MDIFYSWQSDSPNGTNRAYIDKCLSKAIIELTNRYPGKPFKIQQDARDTAGSGHLIQTLLSKLRNCEAFVGDITTINPKSTKRRTPNPNVLYELGFADGVLGENRVILVFNTAIGGKIEHLPFDIRSRRIISFERAAGVPSANENQFIAQLTGGLEGIFQIGPVPLQTGEIATRKRQHDLRWLNDVFERIQTKLLDLFVDDAFAGQVQDLVVSMTEELEGLSRHSGFSFNDSKLNAKTNAFIYSLVKAINISTKVMEPAGGSLYKIIRPMGQFRNRSDERGYQQFIGAAREARAEFRKLLKYTHSHYPEIDTKLTDIRALARYSPQSSSK